MKPRILLCSVGIHNYRTINLTDCFSTTYTDRPSWSPIKHMVYYLQCDYCGKRSFKTTYKKDVVYATHHAGIEYAKVGWIEHGKIYLGDKVATYSPSPSPSKPKLKVIKGDKV